MPHPLLPTAAGLLLALTAVPAFATNGYFLHGYGNGSKAMGGVAYALGQDALAPATNPALLSMLGDRFDVGLDLVRPTRDATITGNHFGVGTPDRTILPILSADGHYDGNARKNFYLPEFGVAMHLNPRVAVGLALYGNGGLQTDYPQNPYGAFQLQGEKTNAGVDLQQLFLSPSVSVRLSRYVALGLAPSFVYQRFKAYGLQAFATRGINVPGTGINVPGIIGPFSEDPDHVTNQGYSGSFGYGFRIGGVVSPFAGLTIGFGGQPKIHMQRFEKYAGLFAGHGVFDVPTNFGGGIAWGWRDRITLAFDVQRILYHQVGSLGHDQQPFVDGVKLGADDGPGFGWRNVNVFKVGAAFRLAPRLLLRAGYSYDTQPVPRDQTLFNILAPAVIRSHYTAGVLVDLGGGYEVSASYLYADDRQDGRNSIPPNHLARPLPPASFGGGEADITGGGQIFGVALAVHY